MGQQTTASGHAGFNLVYTPQVLKRFQHDYYCANPMAKIANLNGEHKESLIQGSKVYFHNSLGLMEDEACGMENGNVTLLHQAFGTDYMELCGSDRFSIKRDHSWVARNGDRLAEIDASLDIELMERQNRKTIPFFMMKLIGSADPSGLGLGAGGIANTSGVATGLGDLNNPIKIDVSSSRKGGNKLQAGTIDMPTMVARMRGNMHHKGVTCSTNKLMLSGGTGLEAAFTQDAMCANDGCSLLGTGLQYDLNSWMPSATGSAGDVSYLVMHDPEYFWAGMYNLYMQWATPSAHYSEYGGEFVWGAKVSRPKSVSVAVVQYV
jgi:hypothetical protein